MPVEVIRDPSLLPLNEPLANTKVVVAHVLTEVEGLHDLFCLEGLLVGSCVDHHGALAAVAHHHSKQLLSELFLSVLIEPMGLLLELTQLAAVFLPIGLEHPLEAHIRLHENAGLLGLCEGHIIGHVPLFNEVGHHYSGAPANASSAHHQHVLPLADVFFDYGIGLLEQGEDVEVRHVVNIEQPEIDAKFLVGDHVLGDAVNPEHQFDVVLLQFEGVQA